LLCRISTLHTNSYNVSEKKQVHVSTQSGVVVGAVAVVVVVVVVAVALVVDLRCG
jgi:hypothetical protein